MDFTSMDELKAILGRYPYPTDVVYRLNGGVYNLRVEVLPIANLPNPGRPLIGTVPISQEAEELFQSKNWRKA